MKTKIIKFSTTYDQNLVNKILELLRTGGLDSYSMLDLSEALGKEYKEGSVGWEKLRLHLIYMAKKRLVEERHFGKIAGDWNGIVDYVPESPKAKWPK